MNECSIIRSRYLVFSAYARAVIVNRLDAGNNLHREDSFANARLAMMPSIPLVAPVFPAGKGPLPPGISEEERENFLQAKKYQDYMTMGMESCAAKTVIAGVGGTPATLLFAMNVL